MKNKSFQAKIYISSAVFVSVLMMLMGIFFYAYTIRQMEKNAAENQINTTIQVQEQLENVFSQMNRLSIAINASQVVMYTLNTIPNDTARNYFDYNPLVDDMMKSVLYSIMELKNFNARVKIISRYYDTTGLTTQYDKALPKSVIRDNTEYVRLMKSDDYYTFLPPHKDIWSTQGGSVASVVRPLRDNYDNIYGLAEINLPVTEIDNMVTGVNIAIIDETGHLVYTNRAMSESQQKELKKVVRSGKRGTVASTRSGLITSFSTMKNTKWRVVQFSDSNDYNMPKKNIGRTIVIIFLLVYLVVMLLLLSIMRTLMRPIQLLTRQVTKADINHLNLRLDGNEVHGDIEMLAQSFQSLVDELQESSRKLLEANSREADTRMMALEAQLNPHFIYNTLSSIGAYGYNAGNPKVYEMCSDLSELLRYTIDFSTKISTIQKEMDHIRAYLDLMGSRYQNRFQTEITIEIDVNGEISIPKMLLQPIVENCFKHGFKTASSIWEVKIHVYMEENEWRICIRDNGEGFSPEARIRVQETVLREDFQFRKDGIGLVNTLIRLRNFYQGEEYFQILNDNGAVVIVGGSIKYVDDQRNDCR